MLRLFIAVLSVVNAKEICYDTVGCFSLDPPWTSVLRPFPAPQSPRLISTKVYFYTRPAIQNRVYVSVYPRIDLGGARFDAVKPTAFIVHGFSSSGNSSWVEDLKNAYLGRMDANVFLVDWGVGASRWNYLQVASNTRVVAQQLINLVTYLVDWHHAQLPDFHLMGHSLGAQICSYVAKTSSGMGRLTAMDPAQPGFEGCDKLVRLDRTDASFVDVIHTDARPFIPTIGLGMMLQYGHVDFYMNGGLRQPGCVLPALSTFFSKDKLSDLIWLPVEFLAYFVSCPHGRSYLYFTEALKYPDCVFWGQKASLPTGIAKITYPWMTKLKSDAICNMSSCVPLGLKTNLSQIRGAVFVSTRESPPYCKQETDGLIVKVKEMAVNFVKHFKFE